MGDRLREGRIDTGGGRDRLRDGGIAVGGDRDLETGGVLDRECPCRGLVLRELLFPASVLHPHSQTTMREATCMTPSPR